MRLPRVRLTVRTMMALVAVVAVLLERLTVGLRTPQGRCEEPPRRLPASPPFRKGGHLRRSGPFLSPPYELIITHNYSRSRLAARKPETSKVRS